MLYANWKQLQLYLYLIFQLNLLSSIFFSVDTSFYDLKVKIQFCVNFIHNYLFLYFVYLFDHLSFSRRTLITNNWRVSAGTRLVKSSYHLITTAATYSGAQNRVNRLKSQLRSMVHFRAKLSPKFCGAIRLRILGKWKETLYLVLCSAEIDLKSVQFMTSLAGVKNINLTQVHFKFYKSHYSIDLVLKI